MINLNKDSINSLEKFKSLFKGIPIPTYAWKKFKKDLILIDYNDAVEKQATSKIKDFLFIKASELYKDQPKFLKNLYKCIENKVNITKDLKYKFLSTEKEGFFHIKFGFIAPDLVIVHAEDISKRIQMEQKLKESEEQLKKLNEVLNFKVKVRTKKLKESEEKYKNERNNLINILNSLEDGVYIVDQQYNIEYINPSLIKEFGPIDNKKCYEYFYNKTESCERCKIQDVLRGKTVRREWYYSKNQKTYEFTGTPLKNPDGSISKVEIFHNITERKKAEEKLKENSESLSEILLKSPIPTVALNKEGKILSFNNALEKLIGYKKDDIKNVENAVEKLFPDVNERHKVIKATERLLNEEMLDKAEFTITRKDGTKKLIDFKVSVFQDGYIIQMIDITERRKFEREIADLAKFISENPYPVLRVHKDYIIYINKAGENLLKKFKDDIVSEIFRDKINSALITNKIEELEVKFDSRTFSFIITPVKDANYINIYGMDITERKLAERELKEISRLKSEFLRRASHELKTPLVSVKGNADLLLNLHYDKFDNEIISIIDEIKDGCERFENLIKDLIEASKLESKQIRLKTSKEDLSFLIRYCIREIDGLAKTRNHNISVEIHDKLITKFAKEELHDVITNLLINSIKYTPPGGTINIKTEVKEDFIIVSVKDNGIGFIESEKDKIFQQFGKIERYGQGLDIRINGSGLGLFISKKIVELHGGKIWMESEGRNKGSTFYFSLPAMND
ncbi:MAG: ATP-binding protein [Promethearchaeota archaeon]